MPDKVARGNFVEKLVSDNLDGIGLKRNNGNVKVLDYGAGTGFFSQVSTFMVDVKQSVSVHRNHRRSLPMPAKFRNRQLARHVVTVQ